MTVIVYRDEEGLWRWRVVSEGYEDKSYAIESAKKDGPTNAVIVTEN
jgi:uncharacterized protein YegP (UPF0339 family)